MGTPLRSLPPDIVQHIQTLSHPRDAARMATLSKYLYAAWSTRKYVQFDERHFSRSYKFWDYAKNTLQRYQSSGLKIATLMIRVISSSERYYAMYELLVYAAKLEVHNLDIELPNNLWSFIIPEDVLFSKSLNRLSVSGGTCLFGKVDITRSSKLTYLRLSPFMTISCGGDFLTNFVWSSPSLKTIVCDGCLLFLGNGQFGNQYHSLESLTLDTLINKDSRFFTELFLRFQSLKALTIRDIYNCPDMLIRSQSLERISLHDYYHAMTAVLNVPNVRVFNFEGTAISSFVFESQATEWSANLRILCVDCSQPWLVALRKLLQNVSASKISLTVNVSNGHNDYQCDYNPEGSIPVVERLVIRSDGPCPGVVDGLFRVCRPKVFSLYKGTM